MRSIQLSVPNAASGKLWARTDDRFLRLCTDHESGAYDQIDGDLPSFKPDLHWYYVPGSRSKTACLPIMHPGAFVAAVAALWASTALAAGEFVAPEIEIYRPKPLNNEPHLLGAYCWPGLCHYSGNYGPLKGANFSVRMSKI